MDYSINMNRYGVREWNGVIIKPFSNIRLTFLLLNEDLDICLGLFFLPFRMIIQKIAIDEETK